VHGLNFDSRCILAYMPFAGVVGIFATEKQQTNLLKS
jgi:hypothetical protein